MRTMTALTALFVLSALTRAADPPQFPAPAKEHEWLQQFVGEWESKAEASMGPGQPPMQCHATMQARVLGGFWVICEHAGDMPGTKYNAIQTIGYDPQTKQYVGSWVDSMTNHMWRYTGTVDATGQILTLEAEGPSFLEPGKTAQFRDAYEFKSVDHIVATSSMLGPDGEWVVFMTGQVTRKK